MAVDSKLEPEPDGQSSPKTPVPTTSQAASATPAPAPSATPETDEFGLPIRQYRSPEPDERESFDTARDGSDDEPSKSQIAAPADHESTEKKPSAPKASAVEVKSQPVKEGDTRLDLSEAADSKTPIANASKSEDKEVPSSVQVSVESPTNPCLPAGTQAGPPSEATRENPPATGGNTTTAEKPKNEKPGHTRDLSIVSSVGTAEGVSEFSHQQLSTAPKQEDEGDGGWQVMPAFARYDMYDDDDRLIAREHDAEEDEKYAYGGLGGAGKGYTRVQLDEDAQSATSMDDNTKYLFKDTATGTAVADEDEDARDAMGQMQATKELLTEGQRIAYAGIVRLEIANVVKATEEIEMLRKVKKDVNHTIEGTKMWGQKMMIRLYSHMDINAAEQIMIEQLAEHGVMPSDLTPALHANARVHNPMAKQESDEERITEMDGVDDTAAADDAKDGKKPVKNGATETKNAAKDSPKGSLRDASPPPSFQDEEVADPPPPYEVHGAEALPDVKTPSQLPSTNKIDIDLRWTVLCDLFLVLIADSIYDARSRVLLERVGQALDVSWIDICRFEKRVTDALEMQQQAEKENWNEDDHLETRRKAAMKRRYMMMGLATVGGGLVIGLSAGLLAPVIGAGLAAGFTTIGVTGTSGFLGGVGGAAIITSASAASGSIIGAKAANKRTGAVKTFEYRPLHNNKRVNLIVTVSGWLTGKVDDVRLPFSTVDPVMGDIYSVLWEPEMLQSMGDTIRILATEALTQSIQQVLGSTILVALMGALQLPIVLSKLSYLIDNPWSVSLDRATQAGKILADSLIERNLGTRPITLVGYSLGSRVIFSCLQEMAKRGAYGLVQNVYLFGSPVVVRKEEYIRARTVVAGRFVNGYSSIDWILGYLFRLTAGGISRVAGLAPIEDLPWIENVNCSELVAGHMAYRAAMPKLLKLCGWKVESEEFTEIEDPDPENHEQRQRELLDEIEEARKELENDETKKKSLFGIFNRRKKARKAEWEVYEDTGGKEGKPGEPKDEYQGALFDVDMIRAELALAAKEGESETMQVKELESTLPPMKLDMSPSASASTTPTSARTETLRFPRNFEYNAAKASSESRLAPTYGRSPAYGGSAEALDRHSADDGVRMTFDSGFDDAGSRPAPPPKETEAYRPPIKSSQTVPNMSNPWSDPDHEDFGKEKEISMTFA